MNKNINLVRSTSVHSEFHEWRTSGIGLYFIHTKKCYSLENVSDLKLKRLAYGCWPDFAYRVNKLQSTASLTLGIKARNNVEMLEWNNTVLCICDYVIPWNPVSDVILFCIPYATHIHKTNKKNYIQNQCKSTYKVKIIILSEE